FFGTRGHAGATEAADILEKFLGQSNGMGQAGQNVSRNFLPRFQPSLGNSLNQTMNQLLAEAGMGQGAGGGYSARRNTMQNVGLYGNTPFLDQPSALRGNSSNQMQNAGGRSRGLRDSGEQNSSSFDTTGSLKASGVGEAVVPLRYRRKVGRYFQRIADELGDQ
ncbi:MAG: hypothetical protein IID46_10175, partial [Planctomycetes bacterium]|nr:hypothetical protein [Planctomycetota bacterium]